MYSVIIGDDNSAWLEALCLMIGKQPDLQVVATALDGKRLIELIETHLPDIIILDIVMPKYDGVYVVEHIRKNIKGYNPIIYIVSGIGTDTIIALLNELLIDFYSLKPVRMEVLMHNLRNIISKLEERKKAMPPPAPAPSAGPARFPPHMDTTEYRIKTIVYQLGLVPHRKSTIYLIDALLFYIQNPDSNNMITKVLYPEVAKKSGVSGLSVEKNIRSAISKIQSNPTFMFHQIFTHGMDERITNSEFLYMIAEFISRNYGDPPTS